MNRGIAALLFVLGGAMVGLELYLNSTGAYHGGHLFTVGGTLALIGLARLCTEHAARYTLEFMEQRAPWARLIAGGFLVFAGLAWRFTSDSNLVISLVAFVAGAVYIIRTLWPDSPPPSE